MMSKLGKNLHLMAEAMQRVASVRGSELTACSGDEGLQVGGLLRGSLSASGAHALPKEP
jgi:hypothetical protein